MVRKLFKNKKLICILALLLVAVIVWIAWGNTALELATVTVTSEDLPEEFSGYRIAHVSDLHNAELGEGNEKLLALLESAEPDIIAITGDIIDSRRTDVDIALDFAEKAVEIAPCYYVTGNHESRVDEDFAKLESGLAALGVTVLRDKAVALECGGESILLIGIDDPDLASAANEVGEKLNTLKDGAEGFTLLLSHRPELFNTYVGSGIDLVLSGHAHGGQIRLPFVGGVIAPHQGIFPKYDSGLYTSGGTNMIVSRGIGNSLFPFRVNNRPEVILIELKSK